MDDDPPPAQQFTDEEVAFWRHVRFGQLPERVRPQDWVETVEAEPGHAGGEEPGGTPSHPTGINHP